MSIFVKSTDSAVFLGAGSHVIIHDKCAAVTFIIRAIATFLHQESLAKKNDILLVADAYLYRGDNRYVRSAYQSTFTRDDCRRVASYINKKNRIYIAADDDMTSDGDVEVVYLFEKGILDEKKNVAKRVSAKNPNDIPGPGQKEILLISQMAFSLLQEYIHSFDEHSSLLNKNSSKKNCCVLV